MTDDKPDSSEGDVPVPDFSKEPWSMYAQGVKDGVEAERARIVALFPCTSARPDKQLCQYGVPCPNCQTRETIEATRDA